MAYVGRTPANAALTADDLADGIVSNSKLATDSVTSNKIVDATVANADLAGSIDNAKLTNSSITINGSAVALGGSVTVGETKPTISSISPDTITNAQTSITITGSNFASVPQVEFLNPSTVSVALIVICVALFLVTVLG